MSQSESTLPQTTPPDNAHVETPPETAADARGGESCKSPLLPLVLALLAFGISIALAVGGYFIWNQLQQLTGEQANLEPRLVQPLQTRLQEISRDWQTGRREIEQQLTTLNARQAALGERVNRLASLVGRSELGWTLAEVEYLLRVASESLQLRRDRRTAEAALKGADARLRELADPQLLPVREQLARELNALREVPEVDFEGLSLRLSDWLQQVDNLPVAGSRYEPPKPDSTAFDTTRTAADWRELPQVIWSSLRELFRIRRHDKPVGPLLPPERIWFLKENLRLQLAAARLALLREDRVAYQQALTTAASWLTAWFDSEDQRVVAMAAGLKELAAVDIRPDLPDISAALHRLQQLRQQQEALATPDTAAGAETEVKAEASAPGAGQAGVDGREETVPDTATPSAEEPPVAPEDAP